MNLIDTNITPDPFDPQTGDVYEFGAPFVQRLVIEDAPSKEDPRVRYRIDGGTDSNLTSVAQFHRHLAGLTDLRGIGRARRPACAASCRECSPLKPDEVAALTWEARFNDGRGGASIYLGGHTAFVSGKQAHDLAEALYPRRTQVQGMRDDIDAWFRWAIGNIDDVSLATASGERLRKNLQDQLDRVRGRLVDLALELDSISALVAPHGVAMPAGATKKPTSLELVRWLAVTGGVVPHVCHPTLAEVQEAQEVDFMGRWDRYESAKRKPAIDEPARPEVGEVDHFPSVTEARDLRLRTEVYRTVGQLREISEQSKWPIRERLQSAAAVMLEVFASARWPSYHGQGQLGALLAMSDLDIGAHVMDAGFGIRDEGGPEVAERLSDAELCEIRSSEESRARLIELQASLMSCDWPVACQKMSELGCRVRRHICAMAEWTKK